MSFSKVSIPKPPMSRFNLSHELKTTLNMGLLVPIYLQETLPGDTFSLNAEIFMRAMPLSSPMMQRVDIFTHFWFVPKRLVWDNWNEFISKGSELSPEELPVHPYINVDDRFGEIQPGDLLNYLGFPIMGSVPLNSKIDITPVRAYNLIFNEFYRDENLQTELDISKADGQDSITTIELMKRAWRHDYFTSCLPFAQKGEPVRLPLGTTAPVVAQDNWLHYKGAYPDNNDFSYTPEGLDPSTGPGKLKLDGGITLFPKLDVDLTGATAATIVDLRRAFQLQKFLERNARVGNRIIEFLYGHFGVISSDARLQLPEYLGGGKSPLVISEVLQTSQTTESSPLATMGGHAVAVGKTNSFSRRFEEHGWIIGIMSVMPRATYFQGLPRQLFRFNWDDYAFPLFSKIGEQEVYNKELYLSDSGNDDIFGYQDRYAEYRTNVDRLNGEFATTLSYWTQARKFANRPALNSTFIQCTPSYEPFAVTDVGEHHLIAQIYFNVSALRPLPRNGEPGLIDHF